MNRPAVAAVAAGAVGLLGVGVWWAATAPTSGTVTGRRYIPAYTTTWTDCRGTGADRRCVPETEYHGTCWQIRYRAPGGRTGAQCVDPAEYRRYRIGSHYPEAGR